MDASIHSSRSARPLPSTCGLTSGSAKLKFKLARQHSIHLSSARFIVDSNRSRLDYCSDLYGRNGGVVRYVPDGSNGLELEHYE